MTLEEVYQSEANLTYAIKMNFPELIGKEDVQNLIDYLNHESIPKEKVREKIKERESKRDNAEMDFASALFERDINLLEELLGE